MSGGVVFPEGTRYVVDRDGEVWLLVRDGGMAMRASEDFPSGVTSAGIQWLENTVGPLVPIDPAAHRRTVLWRAAGVRPG